MSGNGGQGIQDFINKEYKEGFVTDVEIEDFPKGLSEEIIRRISAKKNEPEFMLEFRLKAYRHWLTMKEPDWARVTYNDIDYQDIYYYAAPKKEMADDPEYQRELQETFEKLGVPISERDILSGKVAVDAVFDSISIATTHREKLKEMGVIFCSISEALHECPELVKKYMGSVVPYTDNYFATLNSAVFSDGSFCYIPKGVKCPMDLSTYFRINAKDSGQFERTLIVCEEGASVSYMEGCTAPMRDTNQLHAAVVELVALDDANIKYTTVQNWYAGDKEGRGGIFNFVTKRGACRGKRSKISWTQVETGSAITWKYPSVVLLGDDSIGEFYSVAVTNHRMQADTGTKMIHIGKNTKSRILSKGISVENSHNTYRGEVKVMPGAENAKNFTQCDSLIIGNRCTANTFPVIDVKNPSAQIEHEASTTGVSEEQIFYLRSRGIPEEKAVPMIINGFCEEVFKQLPMEFAVEATRLMELKLEGTVG